MINLRGIILLGMIVLAGSVLLTVLACPVSPSSGPSHAVRDCDHEPACCQPGKNYLHKYDCE